MDKIGSTAPDNVVQLSRYRGRSSQQTDRTDGVAARAFVSLTENGRVRYGIEGADEENALSLLEPLLLIGHRLVLMAAE